MIITIINNKGGSGKTTTSVNLSAYLAASGYRVLLVDLDSQAAASLSLGISRNALAPSAAHVLFGSVGVEDTIRPSVLPGLDLLTGEMELANTDLVLADVPGRERRLSKYLKGVREHYDFIFCDCPPSLSLLSVNAMVASERYIVPVPPEYLALEALIGLMNGIDKMKEGIGIDIELLGVLLTFVNHSIIGNRTSKEIARLIREHYGAKVFKTEIKRDVRLGEAPAYGKSVFDFASKSRGATAYGLLAGEVLERCGIVAPLNGRVDNGPSRSTGKRANK